MTTFKEELQEEMKRSQGASGVLQQDRYTQLLVEVQRLCRDEAKRGKTRWEERLTAREDHYGVCTLMPDDPDLKEQYLERLRADLPGLDVNLFFGGVYLDVSWE